LEWISAETYKMALVIFLNARKSIWKGNIPGKKYVYYVLRQSERNTYKKVTATMARRYDDLLDGAWPSRCYSEDPVESWDNLVRVLYSLVRVESGEETLSATSPANPFFLVCKKCKTFSEAGICKHTMAVTSVILRDLEDDERSLCHPCCDLEVANEMLDNRDYGKGRRAAPTAALVRQVPVPGRVDRVSLGAAVRAATERRVVALPDEVLSSVLKLKRKRAADRRLNQVVVSMHTKKRAKQLAAAEAVKAKKKARKEAAAAKRAKKSGKKIRPPRTADPATWRWESVPPARDEARPRKKKKRLAEDAQTGAGRTGKKGKGRKKDRDGSVSGADAATANHEHEVRKERKSRKEAQRKQGKRGRKKGVKTKKGGSATRSKASVPATGEAETWNGVVEEEEGGEVFATGSEEMEDVDLGEEEEEEEWIPDPSKARPIAGWVLERCWSDVESLWSDVDDVLNTTDWDRMGEVETNDTDSFSATAPAQTLQMPAPAPNSTDNTGTITENNTGTDLERVCRSGNTRPPYTYLASPV